MSAGAAPNEPPIKVLLVDDQAMIGEAIRRMLAGEDGIEFRFCKEAGAAVEEAVAFGPTVILQDLVMPEVDGLELVRRFRAHAATAETPMIVLSSQEDPATKAEAFAVGANDYLVKLPDRLELVARVRYHSKGYINLLRRNEADLALRASQRRLADDLAQAARYVRSLLPAPLRSGPVRADWRFLPSTALGGDTFGYHWHDPEHFAFYLLDVSGHGVGPALLSVSVLNALRSRTLPDADFLDPASVLAALNRAFPMEQQNNLFFTIWYGVYDRASRRLEYAGGGHPPALLVNASGAVERLESGGPMIGAFDALEFTAAGRPIEPGSRLLLYSDGVFEVERADKTIWPFDEFAAFAARPGEPPGAVLDRLIAHAREIGGRETFVDDVSVVEFQFDPDA